MAQVPILTSPETICNAALVRIGYRDGFIANMYDGSPQSNAALAVYGQTRDDLLRSFDWGFAEYNTVLSLLKTAPVFGYSPPSPYTSTAWSSTYPILPWIFEYAYPSDCLKVRSLRPQNPQLPVFDPSYNEFRIADDNSLTSSLKKVILTNLANAVCVYTGQISDPTQWEAGFTESLITALGERLAPVLTTIKDEPIEAQDAALTAKQAEMEIG